MNKFQLKSDYQPKGDQPAAIAALTEGLNKNTKEQTLLGVTGSGKSVTGETESLVRINNQIRRVEIGSFIDEYFERYTEHIAISGETEILNLNILPGTTPDSLEAYSFNPVSLELEWRPIYQLTRHAAPRQLYKVHLSCGRHITVTGDHNLYVLSHGELTLKKTSDLRTGDCLPLPRFFRSQTKGLSSISLWKLLDGQRYYLSFDLDRFTLDQRQLLRQALPYPLWHRLSHDKERLSLEVVKPILNQYNWLSEFARVGTRSRSQDLPAEFTIDNDFLKLMGLFIAEGHTNDRYMIISNNESDIADWLKGYMASLRINIRRRPGTYDYQISSQLLANLMAILCGRGDSKKRLPDWWAELSNPQLAALLAAYMAGDGTVEKNVISACMVSDGLASDLAYALYRFGIVARLRRKLTTHLTANVITVSGYADVALFASEIDMGCRRKSSLAKDLVVRLKASRPNTNVDLIPLRKGLLRKLRIGVSLLQTQVASLCGVERSYVSMLESGVRSPSANLYMQLSEVFEEATHPRLHQLFWSPIREVTRLRGSGYVYDFAVEKNETFLAGHGGLFVHNTFTAANVIQNLQRPTLILSHNKTLAAQLYGEFKHYFPDNAVHYFVSYFDYYQPEAYMPRTDTYIEKDSDINEEIDRLRHAATDALLTRKDVIIVASVSCIYGIGSPGDYNNLAVRLEAGERRVRDKLLRQLSDIQYQRNDIDFHRGTFRVHGDVIDVFPAGEELAYRIELFGDELERIVQIDPLTGEILAKPTKLTIFPSSHYVTPQEKLKVALGKIEQELEQRLAQFKKEGKLLEAQRLAQRTKFDLEMLEETGFVKGIENYSRYLTDREPGEQPATLLDYYPDDYLLFVDESHMTIPQVRGMYNGDRARKEVLVDYGFRLPSALDNRPLTFTEFERHINQAVYVSATPADYELSRSPEPIQQVIRPTGLLDPIIEVRPIDGQIDDLIAEIRTSIEKHHRVLVTTLTKRTAEDLAEYLQELNLKVAYLHSDIETLERTDILRDLRLGTYDVVVGINLLREGLDLPEVSLVAILDADKEGFLRSEQALVQTIGRAARHEEGRVLMYADCVTGSMQRAIDETNRRRGVQEKYNKNHGITPTSISKSIEKGLRSDLPEEAKRAKLDLKKIPKDEYAHLIKDLTGQMDLAAANLQFEKAAELRDIIQDIKSKV